MPTLPSSATPMRDCPVAYCSDRDTLFSKRSFERGREFGSRSSMAAQNVKPGSGGWTRGSPELFVESVVVYRGSRLTTPLCGAPGRAQTAAAPVRRCTPLEGRGPAAPPLLQLAPRRPVHLRKSRKRKRYRHPPVGVAHLRVGGTKLCTQVPHPRRTRRRPSSTPDRYLRAIRQRRE